jgi:hypothetical protein
MFELIVLFLLLCVGCGIYLKHRETMRCIEEEKKKNIPLPLPTKLGGVKQVRRLTPYKPTLAPDKAQDKPRRVVSRPRPYVPEPTPVPVQSSNNDFVTGMVVGALVDEVLHHHSEGRSYTPPDDTPSFQSGGGGDGAGGGSSGSWDSGSDSSSSDSSSSSDD